MHRQNGPERSGKDRRMSRLLIEYVHCEDLRIINQALSQGDDVRIQVTPGNGCRIISDRVHVLKKNPGTGEKPTENRRKY